MKGLVRELEQLINSRALALSENGNKLKDRYEYLECMLMSMIEEAKHLKEDMEAHSLTASSIEAEGYLRFALSVEALLKESENDKS